MDHLCYFCIVFVMLSLLLIAALWPSPRERSDILALICGANLCGCYFPIWYPDSGAVLDLSILDLCPLSYFQTLRIVLHISLFWSSDQVKGCIQIDYI